MMISIQEKEKKTIWNGSHFSFIATEFVECCL